MSYPVQNLIEGRGEPVCVRPDDPVHKALELMTAHDFSQLPVVNEGKQPLGMVTHASILRALANFGVKPDQLLVNDAMVRPYTYRPEEDLFDLLNRLGDTSAILIVDGADTLIGIVTSYDSMEYFRKRAEDMMWIEDIESTVKDLIRAAFTDRSGEVDQERLAEAVEQVTTSRHALQGRYKHALQHYLKLHEQGKPTVKREWLEESFSHLVPKEDPKEFDDLTFYEYIELLLHRDRWCVYQQVLNLELEAVRRLLDKVRETRNGLAHFRGEVSPAQHDELRFCAEWLARHPAEELVEHFVGIPVDWTASAKTSRERLSVREEDPVYETPGSTDGNVVPTEEVLGPGDSRYAPLAIWLQSRPSNQDRVQLTFQDVEEIIGAELPRSAREHRAWWANDTVGHSQSQQWLEAGWRAARIDMTGRKATFARMKKREEAYIDFFNTLQADLGQYKEFPSNRIAKTLGPDGQSWQTVATLPEGGPQALYFVFNFTRLRRFRVELYIDTADQGKNKRIFDLLHANRNQFETALGEELGWERLDQNRASRIAVYHSGFITDDEEQLAQLRAWAVDTMLRFYRVFAEPTSQVLDSVE